MDMIELSKKLKVQTKTIRKREYSKRKSKLDHYGYLIFGLLNLGNTRAEILRHLKTKHVKISHQALTNWINNNGKV